MSLTGLSGQEFHFLSNGDGPSRYRVLNFRRKEDSGWEWVTIGFFRRGNLTLVRPIAECLMLTFQSVLIFSKMK